MVVGRAGCSRAGGRRGGSRKVGGRGMAEQDALSRPLAAASALLSPPARRMLSAVGWTIVEWEQGLKAKVKALRKNNTHE